MEQPYLTLVIITAILIALFLLAALVLGAMGIFSLAAAQGFIGIAVYVACWVFLAPIMAGASIILGIYTMFILYKER
jgi:hypothetical protein